jgi:NAD dependent epimerase/dehydratase family enzyme
MPAKIPWIVRVDGAHGVVHLTGGSIFTSGRRETRATIRAETENRARAIRGLIDAIQAANVKPRVFVAASSVGTYRSNHAVSSGGSG